MLFLQPFKAASKGLHAPFLAAQLACFLLARELIALPLAGCYLSLNKPTLTKLKARILMCAAADLSLG